MADNPYGPITLGQHQPYVDQYDPSLLVPIARQLNRQHLSVQAPFGCDLWTAYELSWLGRSGKPQVAIAEFSIPAESHSIIESKSFKYYLNSFNQTPCDSQQWVIDRLQEDTSQVVGSRVGVCLSDLDSFDARRGRAAALGQCIDHLELTGCLQELGPEAGILQIEPTVEPFEGVLVSHLLKTNCPVTGQPDWASIWMGWKGAALDHRSLLQYIVSYRRHQDFHEHCVERIYADLYAVLEPTELWVYARYTRRGGLDINPFRSSTDIEPPALIAARQ